MRTVFLDRDGVLNRKPPEGQYVTSWQEFSLLPGAAAALRLLNEKDFRVIVVTNQRGVARGLMSDQDVQEIHRRMVAELAAAGAHVDAIYHCPHDDGCECRKPETGLFRRAQSAFPDIDFADSFVIGDSDRDMEAGRRLGARVIRISDRPRTDQPSAATLLEAVIEHVLGKAR